MAASLVELAVPGGLETFHCARSGMRVWTDEGFDPEAEHSPHLRFVIDWAGEIHCVDPDDLPGDQAALQRELVDLLADPPDDWDQNTIVDRCRQLLPRSACVFEILDPPNDGSDGTICYVGFDFADIPEVASLRLETI